MLAPAVGATVFSWHSGWPRAGVHACTDLPWLPTVFSWRPGCPAPVARMLAPGCSRCLRYRFFLTPGTGCLDACRRLLVLPFFLGTLTGRVPVCPGCADLPLLALPFFPGVPAGRVLVCRRLSCTCAACAAVFSGSPVGQIDTSAPSGDRTHDRMLTKRMLCQPSYRGNGW